jgi:hypothetical protein
MSVYPTPPWGVKLQSARFSKAGATATPEVGDIFPPKYRHSRIHNAS